MANGHDPEPSDPADEDDGDDWKQVGPGNKSVVTHSNVDKVTTPISQIFGGQLRSSLCTGSNNKESVVLEPFFTVPLNVQVVATPVVIFAAWIMPLICPLMSLGLSFT